MALSPQKRQQLIEARSKGLTKEQAMAEVFSNNTATARPESRFSDVGEDITSTIRGAGQDIVGRRDQVTDAFRAGARGGQTPIETGAQVAGGAIGAVGDLGFRAIQGLTKPFLRESEEQAIADKTGELVESTGLPQKFNELSPRTQRNISGAVGLFEGATAGVGSAAVSPIKRGISRMLGREIPTPRTSTPEQLVSNVEETLRKKSSDPTLSPKGQSEAAQAALTFKERYIGLTPDVKSRLGKMGEQKLQEYLDAAHIRNVDDTAPTPYAVGAQNVNDTLSKLDEQLRDTGSNIGQSRAKLATIRTPRTSVEKIDSAFNRELNKLNLTVRNGEIVQKSGKVSRTDSASDVRVLQSLYDEMQTFKQSPTLENAIDLRMRFDGRIKFGKAARDVSNSVDPVSRAVRKTIADEAARVVGKSNAAELERYSNFMEAYGDLKSYTDRAAGGEYLLRLVLSGRGGDAQKLIDTVREYTGVDLMNDATAMKVATETLGNENTQNLFRQEVKQAGFDVATVLSGSPVGVGQAALRKLVEYNIDPETVLKAAAAGTGGYLLTQYYDTEGLLLPAGVAVLSAMPTPARRQAIEQAIELNTSRRSMLLANGATETSPAVKQLDKANKDLVEKKEGLSQ